jgi:hypothetical protein
MSTLSTLGEVLRVLWALPRVEYGRRRQGPRVLLEALRCRGVQCGARSVEQRRRLRRAIGLVDLACLRRNCFRRALLEVVLDAGAATEPLYLGFRKDGGQFTGHAWLASTGTAQTFPAQFQL